MPFFTVTQDVKYMLVTPHIIATTNKPKHMSGTYHSLVVINLDI